MKKLILALALMCVTLGVMAQQQKLTITKVKKGEEPKAVMDAIQRDFPKAVSKDLSFLPARLYGEEWNIELEGDQLDEVKYYQISIKDENTDYTAVYNGNGKLLSSKQIIEDEPLPPAVSESIKKFKGWHIDKTFEIIRYNGKKVSDIYRVKIQKGAEHKFIYLDANGNIIDSRIALM